ncbi:hypothetical protein NKR23_g12381 [Pleurostoma richardsiae]|uniref:MADS-box domain-containing protein n=1 Tax=Pleurostoma richardsiae TaxID=41990 RepID=A0AA38VCV0_9PEZI|nr:hypothetical protein NKR23_g12381 [Pleurostoma richardsiae]
MNAIERPTRRLDAARRALKQRTTRLRRRRKTFLSHAYKLEADCDVTVHVLVHKGFRCWTYNWPPPPGDLDGRFLLRAMLTRQDFEGPTDVGPDTEELVDSETEPAAEHA